MFIEKLQTPLPVDNAIIQLGDIDDSQKGRQFKSRFIQAGIAGYPKQFGNVLITKETLDKFVNTLVNKPVIINHKDEIKPEDEVGKVTKVWFNSEDGWFWCEGYLTDETAINLIKDKGWSVSCSYDVLLLDDEGGTENNIKYDKEFLNGKFTHLAIVENPRYERANIVVNSKTEVINNDRWITVHPNGEDEKGRHLLIQDGEDLKEAMQRQWGVYDKRQAKLKSDEKSKKTNADVHKQLNELRSKIRQFRAPENGDLSELRKMKEDYQKILDDWKPEQKQEEKTKEAFYDDDMEEYYTQDYADAIAKDFQDFMKKAEEKKKVEEKPASTEPKQEEKKKSSQPKKYKYTLTKTDVADHLQFGGLTDTGNYYTNGDFAIDKNYLEVKGQPTKQNADLDRGVKTLWKAEKNRIAQGNYQHIKDFEEGELKNNWSKHPIKVAKYSYFDEKLGFTRNVYVNRKYNDIFKNFDLKIGSPIDPIYAYDGKKLIGMVMPIQARSDAQYSKVKNSKEYSRLKNNELRCSSNQKYWQELKKVDNSLTKGIYKIFNSYVPTIEDIPLLQGLIDILEKNKEQ